MVRGRASSRPAAQGLVSLILIILAACAPTVQRVSIAPDGFAGPQFDVAAHRFVSFDGAELGLSSWLPEQEQPWAVIVGLHGMNDYGEAFYPAGPWFAERGVALYAYDARGFGRSPQRGVWPGQGLIEEDVRTALRLARAAHPGAVVAVVGESMGAAAAITALDGGEAGLADRVVLASPAVWGWSSLPDLYALTLWTGAHMVPWRAVSVPRSVQEHIIPSDNTEMLARIGRDPLMLFRTRIDALYGLVGLMESASRGVSAVQGDVIFLYGANDMIIPWPAAKEAAARLPAGARTAVYARGYHMLLRDLAAETVYEDILTVLREPSAPLPSAAPGFESWASAQVNH